MKLLDQLTSVMTEYSAATGLSLARISTLVFNHGAKFELLQQGSDINTRSFERAMCWFSTNWPDTRPWPACVPRPEGEVVE
ncbi:MAG TPA: hypothetical protein VGN75_07630 [Kaistia sp.]|jgi:hypothetical protein|nr:hypothetical protein [Kaistia sp.]